MNIFLSIILTFMMWNLIWTVISGYYLSKASFALQEMDANFYASKEIYMASVKKCDFYLNKYDKAMTMSYPFSRFKSRD